MRFRRQITQRLGTQVKLFDAATPLDKRASLVDFSSNNYLGLAQHPLLAQALLSGAIRYGVGSGSSALVSGHSAIHHELERELARFTGRNRALLFSSGYLANQAWVTALLGKDDVLFFDRLAHASLVDAALLCQATFRRYPHNNVIALERLLSEQRTRKEEGNVFVVTEGVFSMHGDLAPLEAIARVCATYRAILVVDDAHGFGVLGKNGGGVLDLLELGEDTVSLMMATFGKALGAAGAFVAGSDALLEKILQRARSYIYTTALSPALAAAALAALSLVRTEPERRCRLSDRVEQFRHGGTAMHLPLSDEAIGSIQPVLLEEDERALAVSQSLAAQGFLVPAIRPPTVPQGSARLRVSLSADHRPEEIDNLLVAIASLCS